MQNLTIPTNGALMDADQFETLRMQVQSGGSDLERAMLRQMDAMLRGVAAWKRTGDQHRKCWLEAESELLNTRIKVQNVRGLLGVPVKKLKKADLVKLIEQALDELPVVEVDEK